MPSSFAQLSNLRKFPSDDSAFFPHVVLSALSSCWPAAGGGKLAGFSTVLSSPDTRSSPLLPPTHCLSPVRSAFVLHFVPLPFFLAVPQRRWLFPATTLQARCQRGSASCGRPTGGSWSYFFLTARKCRAAAALTAVGAVEVLDRHALMLGESADVAVQPSVRRPPPPLPPTLARSRHRRRQTMPPTVPPRRDEHFWRRRRGDQSVHPTSHNM